MIKATIIIPNINGKGWLKDSIESIYAQTEQDFDLIVVDNGSTDESLEQARSYCTRPNFTLIENGRNTGFSYAVNQGIARAQSKYVVLFNNDAFAEPQWLAELLRTADADPKIFAVQSLMIRHFERELADDAGDYVTWMGFACKTGDGRRASRYTKQKRIFSACGGAALYRKSILDEIGGFDERFAPAYCEDSDLAFEVRKAGYRVVYQPLSKVIHFEGVSNGTDVNGTGLKRYQVENSQKLKEKWADEFKKQCVNDGNPNPFRARERSQGKKVILVVDHYVPTFDKDAGSKTTYQYLKMFLKKGYVVKFLGDNFLHEEPYSTTLQQMGIEILYGDHWATGLWDWLKLNKDEIDVAYLNRPHIATKYVDFIKENTNIKVIYYGHDLHFLRLGREYELTGDIDIKREADYWKAIELSMMRKAAISYYPSYVEINAIHAIDRSINAKAITAYVYDHFLGDIQEDFAKREGLLFVGGFAHPPNADAVLWFAKEIFPHIREQLPDIKFYVVGSKVTDEIKALEQPGNGIIIKGFVSEEELASLYASCKVVVVPLRYGAGVKGKVVEAIYNGAPIITTSTGAEGIPQVEQVLEVEDDPKAFADKTVALYQDNDRCRQMCEGTQKYIREHFSMDGAWKVIEGDFSR